MHGLLGNYYVYVTFLEDTFLSLLFLFIYQEISFRYITDLKSFQMFTQKQSRL